MGNTEESADFTDEWDGWSELIDKWNEYCAHNIPSKYSSFPTSMFYVLKTLGYKSGNEDGVFSRDASGRLIFPSFDAEHQPMAAGRSILTGYMEALWGKCALICCGMNLITTRDYRGYMA